MPSPRRAAVLADSASPLLEEQPLSQLLPQPDAAAGALWRVVASAPSPWDLPGCAAGWPRVPGNVAVLEHPETCQLRLSSGLLPCGRCPACQIGLLLACEQPLRPGVNMPGAFASHLWLPHGPASQYLAPLDQLLEHRASSDTRGSLPGRAEHLAQLLALTAAAGACYQAQAVAGMVPGDTVLVLGSPGPGLLPLRLLAALGLRPIWITEKPPPCPLPPGVQQRQESPAAEELPSPTCHLLLLEPDARLAQTSSLWPLCHSCTFVGPERPRIAAQDLQRLLAGELALRWVADLHPHLALDVASLAIGGQLDLGAWIHTNAWETLPSAYAAFCQRDSASWPVLIG